MIEQQPTAPKKLSRKEKKEQREKLQQQMNEERRFKCYLEEDKNAITNIHMHQTFSNTKGKFTYPVYGIKIVEDVEIWAFGENSKGQLGLGDREFKFFPTYNQQLSKIILEKGIQHLSLGNFHSALLTGTGELYPRLFY